MKEKDIVKKLDDFTKYCRDNGLNVTYQRLAIYRVLLEANEQISPEKIFRKIKESYPNISLGTIYKTLDVFREHNLIRKVNDIFRVSGYDIRTDQLHYMVCRKCNKLIEIPAGEVSEVKINKKYSSLFHTEEVTIFFRGLCSDCK